MWEILPERASTFAGDIDSIIINVTYFVGAWTVATYLIFFYFMFAYRRKEGVRSRYVAGTGKQMLWILIPVFFIAVNDFYLDVINTPIWDNAKIQLPESDQRVRIVAKQWAWEFYYPGADGQLGTADDVKSINTLHVQVDKPVVFELTAEDVLHSFSVPVFRVKQDAIPGRTILGWFEAIKKGEWDVQCTEICGQGHTVMAARVKVLSSSDYQQAIASLSEGMQGQVPATIQTAALLADPATFVKGE